jgi:hypothetical protein
MTDEPPAHSKGIFLAAALAVALGTASPALAGPDSLRQGLFGRRADGRQQATPPIARYVSEGGGAFVLDRTKPRPLLKFENSPEVWALLPQPGPRGDVIYKNDLGEPVLRATRLGGVTVFTDDRPAGSAAALTGPGAPLRLAPMGPQEVFERLAQASARASRAARHLIAFNADADPQSAAVIADAATVASIAIIRMSAHPKGRGMVSRLRQVLLAKGRKASAQFSQDTLVITVVPGQGLAGRPSSELILAVATAG